ncbi:MAG: secretin and TonB N-terminal domain-containing protein [Candidatus Omnitrophica bacterium]|nr:secretin and TonB N-terminal domain-containing protein [Candidatus Omnitrophota bacterium]
MSDLKTKIYSRYLSLLIFLAVPVVLFSAFSGAASAEENGASVQAEPAAGATIVDRKIESGNITIDFKEADIVTVLRVLSEKSGVNIVASKDVEGYVTVRLTNVPWEKALDIICKNYGYAFEREGNIIRVTTVENLKQEELTTEVFTLNYANASEVAEAIKEMVTERGKDKIKYDSRTNVLIVTDIPTNLYKIRQVVEKLDRKTPQVLIQTKIIETTLDDDENMGIDWTVKFGATGAARPWVFPFDSIGSRILGHIEMGEFFPIGKGAPTTGGVGTTTIVPSSDFPSTSSSSMPMATTDQFTMGTLDFSQFAAILEFLKSRRDTNIISDPKVTTLNNKEASIHIGTIIAIPTFERNPDTGTIEITGYTEKDLGIKLAVTPHVNDNGDIVVDLKPEVSELLGYDVLDSARGIRAPRYSTREAETQLMVKNSETIMLGGLLKENTINYKKKVPFLGDIPMVGPIMFTKTEEGTEKTELIIFMTVYLVSGKVMDIEALSSNAFVEMAVGAKD